MAQFSAYHNLNPLSKNTYPYLLDIQTTLLNDLETRLVIPLTPKKKLEKGIIKNLNPIIKIENKEYIVLTQQMAAIPIKNIGAMISECLSNRQEIIAAVDFLITGI
jgi:CcdB protein.